MKKKQWIPKIGQKVKVYGNLGYNAPAGYARGVKAKIYGLTNDSKNVIDELLIETEKVIHGTIDFSVHPKQCRLLKRRKNGKRRIKKDS